MNNITDQVRITKQVRFSGLGISLVALAAVIIVLGVTSSIQAFLRLCDSPLSREEMMSMVERLRLFRVDSV